MINTRISLPISVDNDLTVEQLAALGNHHWVNSQITNQRFPLNLIGQEKVTVSLFRNDYVVTDQAVLKAITTKNFRRPNIKEGLALCGQHSDLSNNGPLIIMCEPWHGPEGYLCVPCLRNSGTRRILDLYRLVNGWLPGHYFAAVEIPA